MVTREKKRDKKTLLAVILLLIAFIIIISMALAFFSDYVTGELTGEIGGIELNLKSFTAEKYHDLGAGYVKDISSATGITGSNGALKIENLNPSDIIVVSFNVENIGNKSAHIRAAMDLLVEDGYGVNPGLYAGFKVYDLVLDATYPTIDDYIDELISPTSSFTPRTGTQSGTSPITMLYGTTPSVVSGDSSLANAEIEGTAGNDVTVSLVLYFDPASTNEYRGKTMACNFLAQAVQYRGNVSFNNWATFVFEQVNP